MRRIDRDGFGERDPGRNRRFGTIQVLAAMLVLGMCRPAMGQASGTYYDTHDFGATILNTNGKAGSDGLNPVANVSFDQVGNMYGTSFSGGQYGKQGLVWEYTRLGEYLDLHDFGGSLRGVGGTTTPDGATPTCSVAIDKLGNLYGTTQSGGANGKGIVWEITTTGQYLDLHDFGGSVKNSDGGRGPDGASPWAGVTIDLAGNLFGTTVTGGSNGRGVVWEVGTTGSYLDLHDFGGKVRNTNGIDGPDGANPYGGVTIDGAGNLFGTAQTGGPNSVVSFGNKVGSGIVWEIMAGGPYLDLHDFGGTVTNANGLAGPDGYSPWSEVSIDVTGNIYGTAGFGGPNVASNGQVAGGAGMIWEITQYPFRQYSDLHDFGEAVSNKNGTYANGVFPWSGVDFDQAGNLFGTTRYGGPNIVTLSNESTSAGLVWEFTMDGHFLDLHDFGGDGGVDGATPYAGVVLDGFGNAVGACRYGGQVEYKKGGDGMIWGLYSGTPPLMSLFLAPTSIVGGNSVTGIVNLVYPAPANGLTISVSSSGASVQTPTTVTVPPGETFANFTLPTAGVDVATQATIKLTSGNTAVSSMVTVLPAGLAGVSLSPTNLVGGNPAKGTVSLNGLAGPSGVPVSLGSPSPAVNLPRLVTVANGQGTASFGIPTTGVGFQTTATVTASFAGKLGTATLTIVPASLVSISVNPAAVTGGSPAAGSVSLDGVAGPGGLTVLLKSSIASVQVPSSVTVTAGQSAAKFTLKTAVVARAVGAQITASVGSTQVSAQFTVNPPVVSDLSLSPPVVVGSATATCIVTLSGPAPPGGADVKLVSNSTSALVPGSVSVARGATRASFKVRTVAVAGVTVASISGTLNGATQQANLTINPPAITSLKLSPSSVVGGKISTGTVTLSVAAPASGLSVNLTCSGSFASVPGSISIAGGKRTATFAVHTVPVGSITTATVSATLDPSVKTAWLSIRVR